MTTFNTFNTLKRIYKTTVPFITIYSTCLGIDTAISVNKILYNYNGHPFDIYSNLIGYTSLGIITGLTYPISYPAFGYYLLYKNNKS